MKNLLLFLLLPFYLIASPFNYDLHVSRFPGETSRVMLCFHGMGGNWKIGELIRKTAFLDQTLISFNFPDHGLREGSCDPKNTSFGTMNELLPPLFVLKTLVVDEGHEAIDLYGYSAGGGALVNCLSVLNTMTYDNSLSTIGLDQKGKEKILRAIEKGTIILDTPLKSVGEIIDFKGPTLDLVTVASRYQQNDLVPIDSIEKLKNLKLSVIIHFQTPDQVLSNRDDFSYIERFKKINQGMTYTIVGFDSGHWLPHPTLWQFYHQHLRKDAAFVWKRFDSFRKQALFQYS